MPKHFASESEAVFQKMKSNIKAIQKQSKRMLIFSRLIILT